MNDRVVFDCMVFLQAVLNENGPAFGCMRLVDDDQIALCISEAVLAEVIEVLSRPQLRSKFPRLTPQRVEMLIRNVHAKAIAINHVPLVFAYPRDPDDEKYVNLAFAASAKYLSDSRQGLAGPDE